VKDGADRVWVVEGGAVAAVDGVIVSAKEAGRDNVD
jgi:hypothetical protein